MKYTLWVKSCDGDRVDDYDNSKIRMINAAREYSKKRIRAVVTDADGNIIFKNMEQKIYERNLEVAYELMGRWNDETE